MTEATGNYDRRENYQWIREAHKEIKTDLDELTGEVKNLHADFGKFADVFLAAIPDPKVHDTSHLRIDEYIAERKAKEENDAKLKLEVRNGLVKTAINAAVVFVCGVFLLGAQAQFGIWVEKAQAPKVTVESSTKDVK